MKAIKILLVILTIQFVNTQIFSQTTFSKALDILNKHEYGDELELHKGNYYIAGRGIVWDSINEKLIRPDYIHVLDSDLQKINTFTMREEFYGVDLYYDTDTIYYLGFVKNIWSIYKFSLSGDSLDIIAIDTFKDFDQRYIPLDIQSIGGDFFIRGEIHRNEQKGIDVFVMKVSKGGIVKRVKKLSEFAKPKYLNDSGNMAKTIDGNFAIPNYYQYVTEDWDDFFTTGVCKFDEDLNILWYRYFRPTNDRHVENMRPWVVGTSDSGLVVRSAMYFGDSILEYQKYRDFAAYPTLIYKLDKNGNTIWTDTIFYKTPVLLTGPDNTGEGIIEARNRDIIMCGFCFYPQLTAEKPDKPNYRAWLCRYSPDGHLKWQHYYLEKDYPGNTDFFDVEEAENGDIVCVGQLQNENVNDGNNNSRYTWLIRLDSTGCHPGIDCNPDSMEVLVDIPEVIKNPTNIQAIELNPNPAKDYININTSEDIKWQSWTIYNFEEQKLKSGAIQKTNKKQNIDISSLQSGIYFMLLKSDRGKYGLGKFVVED